MTMTTVTRMVVLGSPNEDKARKQSADPYSDVFGKHEAFWDAMGYVGTEGDTLCHLAATRRCLQLLPLQARHPKFVGKGTQA